MRAVVAGYGSIGARHARILTELGCQVALVSTRKIVEFPCYPSLGEAVAKIDPDYVVVANRTHDHWQTLSALAELNYTGQVLVEKPLFDGPSPHLRHNFAHCFVGYNLRFHPVVQKLSAALKGERILSAQAYVGQYLPHWRPHTDYRSSYSAHKSLGGGVLRDLSHELDLIQWLLGRWTKLASLMGHHSHLEIDSEDVVAILMATEHCPVVTVQLNYLDRIVHRDITINTDNHTFRADLIHGTLQIDEDREDFVTDRDVSFVAQHRAVLQGNHESLCTFAEGMAIVETIDAAEHAFQKEMWVKR